MTSLQVYMQTFFGDSSTADKFLDVIGPVCVDHVLTCGNLP